MRIHTRYFQGLFVMGINMKWAVSFICCFAVSLSSYAYGKVEKSSTVEHVRILKDDAQRVLVELDIATAKSGFGINVIRSDKELEIHLTDTYFSSTALKQEDGPLDDHNRFDADGQASFSTASPVTKMNVSNSLRTRIYFTFNEESPPAYFINQSGHQLLIHLQHADHSQKSISAYYENTPVRNELLDLADKTGISLFVFDDLPVNANRLWLSNIPAAQSIDLILQANQLTSTKHQSTYLLGTEETHNNLTSSLADKTWEDEKLRLFDKISLYFMDIEIKQLIHIFSDFSGQSVVYTQTDLGNMGVHVDDMPWIQVLDYIVKAKGLATKDVGNITIIAYPHEMEAAQEAGCFALPVFQGQTDSSVMLKHIQADDVLPQIQALLDKDILDPKLCPGLETQPYGRTLLGSGQYINFKASTQITEEVKQLIQTLDRP